MNYVFESFWTNLECLGLQMSELNKLFEISLGLFESCEYQRNVVFVMVFQINAANYGFHVNVAVDRFQERFVAHQGRGPWTWPQVAFGT